MTPKVCILNEDDARSFTYGGIAQKCASRRHHHYGKSKWNTGEGRRAGVAGET